MNDHLKGGELILSIKLMLLLELQRKFNISFQNLGENTIEITIGKWDDVMPFLTEVLSDPSNQDKIKIMQIDERTKTIIIQYDEQFFIHEHGWKLWLEKYEGQLQTYVYDS